MTSQFPFSSIEASDQFCAELRRYNEVVDSRVKRTIGVIGMVLGVIMVPVFLGKMDVFIPDAIASYPWAVHGLALVLASGFAAFAAFDEGLYRWALTQGHTKTLESLTSTFGETETLELTRFAARVLPGPDLSSVEVKYHSGLGQAVFPCSALEGRAALCVGALALIVGGILTSLIG